MHPALGPSRPAQGHPRQPLVIARLVARLALWPLRFLGLVGDIEQPCASLFDPHACAAPGQGGSVCMLTRGHSGFHYDTWTHLHWPTSSAPRSIPG